MTRRRLIFFAALIAVFSGSIVAWTQTNSTFALNITPYGFDPDNPDAIVGQLAEITPIDEEFHLIKNKKAWKIGGIELYEIELVDTDVCDEVRIRLTLLNPYDMGQVFNNPNSFIDLGVWYPVEPTGAEESVVLDHNGQTVWRDDSAKASRIMTSKLGAVVLYPSKTVTSTLYILASIMVPGGAPPGQQGQLTDLRIQCSVEK